MSDVCGHGGRGIDCPTAIIIDQGWNHPRRRGVEVHTSRVWEEDDGPFDDEFWSSGCDVELNALDNVEARLFVDSTTTMTMKRCRLCAGLAGMALIVQLPLLLIGVGTVRDGEAWKFTLAALGRRTMALSMMNFGPLAATLNCAVRVVLADYLTRRLRTSIMTRMRGNVAIKATSVGRPRCCRSGGRR